MGLIKAADSAAVAYLDDVHPPVRSFLDRTGSMAQQPPLWGGVGLALAVAGGAKGRRAAARGAVLWATAGAIANFAVKPLVRRSRPPKARRKLIGPATSSFPSGHSATDVAFLLGVSQEIPWTFLPLAVISSAGHWSLVRTRGHYPSDVLAGECIGIAVALIARQVWPSADRRAAMAGDS